MTLRYLTFDCYGTLIDWKKGIEDNFKNFAKFGDQGKYDIFKNYVAIESRLENNYSSYRQILATTFLEMAHQLSLDPSKQDADGFADSITLWPAFEDTSLTLKSLGKKGYQIIILSNIDRILLKRTIENSELEVNGYITAEDVKSYKPQKAHWVEVLRTYGLSTNEMVHIAGSIYHDIIPASEMGLKTIWVNRYREPFPTKVVPTYTVDDLREILKIL